MKTALLLTSSAHTQRLLSDILGQNTNLVLLPPPANPDREKFDALFSAWLRLADAIIVDAASIGESTRWAIESLGAAGLQQHQAVVVRATAEQQALYPAPPGWFVISDSDSADQLKQSLGAFFELRDTQARLKQADAFIAQQNMPAEAARPESAPYRSAEANSPAEHSRYRDAIKNVSRVLNQPPAGADERTLLAEFSRFVRELLGVGRLALFTRRLPADLFADQPAPVNSPLTISAGTGIAPHVVEHVRLTTNGGIGGYLARQARILRRAPAVYSPAPDHGAEIIREFDLLGTDVAVPMYEHDQLSGVLTFSGRITGEPLSNEELELVWHLLTQLAQALRNLRQLDQIDGQQRFMSEVLAHVQSGVVVIGETGRILNLNRRAHELLELGDRDVTGQEIRVLPSRVADVLFEALHTGQEIRQQEVTVPRGSRLLGVSATRFAPASSRGGLVAVGLIEDLTELKLREAQARAWADKEFFLRLAARLSHELKNSITSIKIFAQLLPERYTEKEFRDQFSGTVASEVNRVDLLVNNLTFFAHPLVLVCEDLVLSELIEACVKSIGQEFARKQTIHVLSVGEKPPEGSQAPVVTVKRNFSHKFARLEGDRIRLTQAFEHVVRNAVQAMPAGGRLTISTADAEAVDFPNGGIPAGGAVRIEWQDTGEGIALENLKRVTEPFVTTRNVGVGLGLTIVKKIVERHGGRLEIDSLLGRGTTVVMWLPVKAQPHPDDELAEAKGKLTGVSEGAGKRSSSEKITRR
jgi:signal transduction histidine kinase